MAYSNFSEACDFPKTGEMERTFCLIFRKFSSNQNNEKKTHKKTQNVEISLAITSRVKKNQN